MNSEVIAEYEKLKIEVDQIEKKIEAKFKLLETSQKVMFDRNIDYGKRCFVLTLFFDEINIDVLTDDVTKEMREMLAQHFKLRERQRKIELEVYTQKAIEKQNLDTGENRQW